MGFEKHKKRKERKSGQTNVEKRKKVTFLVIITLIVLLREVNTSATAIINIALSGKHFSDGPTTTLHSVRIYDCD